MIYGTLVHETPAYYQRRLDSARQIVTLIRAMENEDFLCLPLLFGLCWIIACDVLIAEQKRLRRLSIPESECTQAELDSTLDAMARMGVFYPTMKIEVRNVTRTEDA
ncbi:hypothetical protein BOTBODRAFT_266527 [Botryobasidium botryosum FD-172 SS1]|uniref:Uncharacterized protein n=1 Tax=Botryobasidium botryosum (strain FD-172 SS1) TaxID=930990 RepID=A0A067MMU6_BOTB1|nr:hypothetical protein BOTBODRAFT_266527 [Botryobasidium botryosum FD-172 SS1]